MPHRDVHGGALDSQRQEVAFAPTVGRAPPYPAKTPADTHEIRLEDVCAEVPTGDVDQLTPRVVESEPARSGAADVYD